MKNLVRIILLVSFSGFILSSCKKEFLNTTPVSFNSDINFFQTEADFDRAIAGVYNKLLTFPDINNLYLSECRSNNYFVARQDAARDYFNISGFEVSSQLGTLQTAWNNDYALIFRANKVLEKISPFAYVDTARKSRIQGEARFLRALAYFELVKAFGPVPLVDRSISSSEAFNYPRASIDSVYNFIVSDLQYATTVLPASYTGTDLGRATKFAALGMLGRAYLFMAGYPLNKTAYYANAKTVLKQVLDAENTGWRFAPNYSDLFKTANDNRYNLFEVQYVSGGLGLGSVVPGEAVPLDVNKSLMPYNYYYMGGVPSDDLIASFENGDRRKMVTIDTVYRNTVNAVIARNWFRKFLDTTATGLAGITSNADWPINFPLLRGEDAMLMYCEAINETGGPTDEAKGIVNRIRTRAGLPNLTAAATASKDAFKLALEHERRVEFAWEGLYWWDLVRTGRALGVMNPWLQANYQKTIDQTQFIYPVPYSEMVIKPGLYQQNPGYPN